MVTDDSGSGAFVRQLMRRRARQVSVVGGDLFGMDFDEDQFEFDDDLEVGLPTVGRAGLPRDDSALGGGADRVLGEWLASSGPVYTLLAGRERAGVGIADLRVLRDDGVAVELIVEFQCGGGR